MAKMNRYSFSPTDDLTKYCAKFNFFLNTFCSKTVDGWLIQPKSIYPIQTQLHLGGLIEPPAVRAIDRTCYCRASSVISSPVGSFQFQDLRFILVSRSIKHQGWNIPGPCWWSLRHSTDLAFRARKVGALIGGEWHPEIRIHIPSNLSSLWMAKFLSWRSGDRLWSRLTAWVRSIQPSLIQLYLIRICLQTCFPVSAVYWVIGTSVLNLKVWYGFRLIIDHERYY